VIFLFCATPRRPSSRRWPCRSPSSHLRRHVPARLLGQQHLAARLTLRRLRGRRCHRHAREHRPHIERAKGDEAALKGSKEIGFTIVSMTISLVASSFRGLHEGMLGRLLNEFASPSASHPDLRLRLPVVDPDAVQPLPAPARKDEQHGRFYRAMEAVFQGLRFLREEPLQVLRLRRNHPGRDDPADAAHRLALYKVPSGLLPNDDIGGIFAFTRRPGDLLREMKRTSSSSPKSSPKTQRRVVHVLRGPAATRRRQLRLHVPAPSARKERTLNADQ